MSLSTLAKVFPKSPEQFPNSSEVMPDDLRIDAFRPASGRILRALDGISRTDEDELPEGWIKLEKNHPVSDVHRSLSIVNLEQRLGTGTSVREFPDGLIVVNGLVRVFDGDEMLEVIEECGSEIVDVDNIPYTGLGLKGVIEEGNPYFQDPEIDCEPELQILAIDLENYKDGRAEGGSDQYSVNYAFYDKPPVGDQKLVEITQAAADFLENIPVGEPTR